MWYADAMSYWTDDIEDFPPSPAEILAQQEYEALEGYCDYCECTGHTFRTCSRRDDVPEDFD